MMRKALVLLLILVAFTVPAVEAAPSIQRLGISTFKKDVVADTREAIFEFDYPFQVSEEASAYVKVLPTPWNPALLNGSVGAGGWWTEILFGTSKENVESVGSTNGTDLVELGTLAGETPYFMVIRVHAPGGALAKPGHYRLNYALAVRNEDPAGGGSGGVLDPSDSIAVDLYASQAAVEPEKAAVPNEKIRVYLALAVLALLALIITANKVRKYIQSRGEEPADEPEAPPAGSPEPPAPPEEAPPTQEVYLPPPEEFPSPVPAFADAIPEPAPDPSLFAPTPDVAVASEGAEVAPPAESPAPEEVAPQPIEEVPPVAEESPPLEEVPPVESALSPEEPVTSYSEAPTEPEPPSSEEAGLPEEPVAEAPVEPPQTESANGGEPAPPSEASYDSPEASSAEANGTQEAPATNPEEVPEAREATSGATES